MGFIFLLLFKAEGSCFRALGTRGKRNPFSPPPFLEASDQVFVGLSCNLTTFPVRGLGASPGLGMGPFVCTAAGTAWSKRKQLEEEPFEFGHRAGPCQMPVSPLLCSLQPGALVLRRSA